ncbi:hypothetical protein D3C87_1179410 [compost metagenome]
MALFCTTSLTLMSLPCWANAMACCAVCTPPMPNAVPLSTRLVVPKREADCISVWPAISRTVPPPAATRMPALAASEPNLAKPMPPMPATEPPTFSHWDIASWLLNGLIERP